MTSNIDIVGFSEDYTAILFAKGRDEIGETQWEKGYNLPKGTGNYPVGENLIVLTGVRAAKHKGKLAGFLPAGEDDRVIILHGRGPAAKGLWLLPEQRNKIVATFKASFCIGRGFNASSARYQDNWAAIINLKPGESICHLYCDGVGGRSARGASFCGRFHVLNHNGTIETAEMRNKKPLYLYDEEDRNNFVTSAREAHQLLLDNAWNNPLWDEFYAELMNLQAFTADDGDYPKYKYWTEYRWDTKEGRGYLMTPAEYAPCYPVTKEGIAQLKQIPESK